VLIRWAHPALGSIPPLEFIALAEATGLMVPLTDWILTAVLRHMRAWPSEWERLKISVNISPSSLHQPEFAKRLATLMSAFMVTPDRLELELTEGTLTSDEAGVAAQISEIQAMGMSIAIDDFGTGYSNLDYLTRLPAQVLKIDQSFIRTMDTDERRFTLARAIIELAHKLGYRVVAEGIETQEILGLLKSCGCDEGQGYFFARPMPEAQFQDWLRANLDGPRTVDTAHVAAT
jgi:EAL domain-containing protein (putative c-di-GMP-specific phosphodiesterase class I)